MKKLSVASFWDLQCSLLSKRDFLIYFIGILTSFSNGVTLPLFALFFSNATTQFHRSPLAQSEILYQMGLNTIYLGIASLFSGFIMIYCWIYIGKKVSGKIRKLFLSYLLNCNHISVTIEPFRIKNEIIEIENGLGLKVGLFLFGLTIFVSSIIIIFVINWKFGVINLYIIVGLIIIGFSWFFTSEPGIYHKKNKYELGNIKAEETFSNIFTVLCGGNFYHEFVKYKQFICETNQLGLKNGKIFGICIFLLLFFTLNSFAITIYYAGQLTIKSKLNNNIQKLNLIEEGDALVVIVSLLFGEMSLSMVSSNAKLILKSCVNAFQFFQLKDELNHLKQNENFTKKIAIPNYDNKIALKVENFYFGQISFEAKTGKKTIINLENITYHEKYSLVYELIEAIEGFSHASDFIELFNNPIKDYQINKIRDIVGFVIGNCYLLNLSIYDNIIWPTKHYNTLDTNKYQKAIQISLSNEIINDYGKDFIVGKNGILISHFKRFKISIARLIMSEAKIFIIDFKYFNNKPEIKEIDQKLYEYTKEKKITYIALNLSPQFSQNDTIIYNFEIFTQIPVLNNKNHKYLFHKPYIHKNINQTKQINKEDLKEISNKNLLNYPGHLAISIIMTCINGTMSPLYSLVIGNSIIALSDTNVTNIQNNTIFYALMFFLLATINAISSGLQSYSFNYLGENIKKDHRLLLYRKYLNFNYGFFINSNHFNCQVVTKLNIHSKRINGYSVSVIFSTIQKIVSFIIGFSLSVKTDYRICLISLCFLPVIIMFLVFNYQNNKANPKFSNFQFEIGYSILVEDCIYNRKLVNSLNSQDKIYKKLDELLKDKNEHMKKKDLIYALSFGFGLFSMLIGDGLMLIASSEFINDDSITFNTVIKSSYTIILSSFTLIMLQGQIKDLSLSMNVIQAINSVMKQKSLCEGFNYSLKRKNSLIKGNISIINLNFTIGKFSFKPISLNIKERERIVIWGKGKSLLLKLIMRLYDVEKGKIIIDGIDINKWNVCDLRYSIAFLVEGFNYDYAIKNCEHECVHFSYSTLNEIIEVIIRNKSIIIIDDENVIEIFMSKKDKYNKMLEGKTLICTTHK